MRLRLDTLLAPIDPVVAMHPSSRDADAAVAALRKAGYDDGMLSVVGQSGPGASPHGIATAAPQGRHHWAASGTGLGLLWSLFTTAVVWLHPAGMAGVAELVTMSVLTLGLQAAVMAHVVTPRRRAARERAPGASPGAAAIGNASWRFLVVVHGNRSEVALARDILAAR